MQAPFAVTEAAVALSSAGSTTYSTGANVGKEGAIVYAPVGQLGLSVVVSGFGAGEVDIAVQTATSEADTDSEWVDTGDRINGIGANGTYQIEIVNPILDKVRIAIEINSTATMTLTPTWVSDNKLELI